MKRVEMVSEAVNDFAAANPAEGMRILRYCLGACRVHHLCQTSPAASIREDVINPVTHALRNSLTKLLGCAVTENLWEQASLPSPEGLGLQDPADSAEAARLASLVNIGELLASLGVSQESYEAEVDAALLAYAERWNFQVDLPSPDRDLQKSLTARVRQHRRDCC